MTEQRGRIHNQVAELLSAYIDDEVTAEEQTLVEAHLATCTACSRDLVTLRQTVALLKELPQVAAPRPFTLREGDVRPSHRGRAPWWRLPWSQRLVAAAALLLCVAAVGGLAMLRGSGMVGAPAPESVALQAPVAPETFTAAESEPAAEQTVVEEKVEAEATLEVESQVERAVPAAAPEALPGETNLQQEAPPAPTATVVPEMAAPKAAAAEVPPLDEMSDRAASEMVETETAVAGEAQTLTAGAPTQPAAGAPALPSPTPVPAPVAITASPTPVLIEVQDLSLEIQPGLIRASGRLPFPEGRKLHAELWQEDQPLQWAIPPSQQTQVQASGRFSLELKAMPDHPAFNLLAAAPAQYEIRIRPVDPPESVEARIPFDTYGPPTPLPTSSP